MIDAAIFDWGDVVSGRPEPAALRRLEPRLGLAAGALGRFFEPGPFFTMEEWMRASGGDLPEADFWALVCARFPVPPSPELAALAFETLFLAPARPAMVSLLDRLRRRCRLALLSNATPSLRLAVEPLALFDHVLVSADLRRRKPDPAAFRAALASLDAAPERTVFVDDADYNVAGAAAVGLCAHRYRRMDLLRRWLDGLGLLDA